jgi:MFS transporter, SP family, arabinose:H+ symporter
MGYSCSGCEQGYPFSFEPKQNYSLSLPDQFFTKQLFYFMGNSRLLFWCVTAALGGFLFGFDTAVISGAEKAIQRLWGLSDLMVGQMVAMGLYGTILGSLLGGYPAETFGRKPTLLWIGILFLICSVGSAWSPNVEALMLFRFIGGVAVGASSVVAPMYITEIAPKERRGQLTALFQFNIVLGILIAYLSNWLIGGQVEGGWRLMLGIMAVPSVLYLIMTFFVPESPRWLIVNKNNLADARKILGEINSAPETEAAVEAIRASGAGVQGGRFGLRDFFSGPYNTPILLAFLFAFFNQLSGINAVIYYAPRILEEAGLGESTALLSTTGIGVVNLLFTMFGLTLIDKYGRRFLMYIGSIGYIFSLACIAFALFSGGSGMFVTVLLFLFIASHAIGQGAVIWVFISEIFPNQARAFGNSWGCGTHWVFAALIAGFFPYFNQLLGGTTIFALFAVMMVFQLLFVWKMMPETKGVALEDMERRIGH